VVLAIQPPTGYDAEPTAVTVTGQNFGPPTSQDHAPTIVVMVGDLACEQVIVLSSEKLTCVVPKKTGARTVTVILDGTASDQTDVIFTDYDNAGHFTFSSANYKSSDALEGDAVITVRVQRNYVEFASPATVTIDAMEADASLPSAVNPYRPEQFAIAGTDFVVGPFDVYFGPGVFEVDVDIPVKLRAYADARMGPLDDRSFAVVILAVNPQHGIGTFSKDKSVVRILAACELVGPGCGFFGGPYGRTVQ